MATVKSLQAALHKVIDNLSVNDTHKEELHAAVDGTDTTETTEGADNDGIKWD